MEHALAVLRCETSSKDLRSCIEMLIKIFRNVIHNPEEIKYRSLRTANEKFYEAVWQFDGGQLMMSASGWQLQRDSIVLAPAQKLTEPLNFLIYNRNVKPSEAEWVPETKHVIPNADKEKERQLRAQALIKKEKDMAELKKDMDERKAIAERIIAEHRSDIQKRKVPVTASTSTSTAPATAAPQHRQAVVPFISGTPHRLASQHSGAHPNTVDCRGYDDDF